MSVNPHSLPRPRAKFILSLTCWISALALGLKMMVGYELQPGTPGRAPLSWPMATGLLPDAKQPSLVLFLHPECPCSRATVAELAQIVTAVPGQFTTLALIYAPADEAATWADAELVQTVRHLPGVSVLVDVDGRLAREFGASTSGQAMLFDVRGQLRFSGGITGARGHEGDNAGRRAVIARIAGRETTPLTTPVFGCALFAAPASVPAGS